MGPAPRVIVGVSPRRSKDRFYNSDNSNYHAPATGESDAIMNANEVLRIVDSIHRDKNIEKEIVFEAIEAALVSAAKKQYGEDQDITVVIDRVSGAISGTHNGAELDPQETLG